MSDETSRCQYKPCGKEMPKYLPPRNRGVKRLRVYCCEACRIAHRKKQMGREFNPPK